MTTTLVPDPLSELLANAQRTLADAVRIQRETTERIAKLETRLAKLIAEKRAAAGGAGGAGVRRRCAVTAKHTPGPRYIANGVEQPLTARELRDWQGRVEVGHYTIRPVDGNRAGSGRDAWNLFVRLVVGRRHPIESDGFVEEFATFRDALAAAKKGASKDAALRAAGRLP